MGLGKRSVPNGPSARPVLIIEDDTAVRAQLAGVFEDEGCRTVACGSAREGLGKLQGGGYALLITDLHLPDASGLEVVERAKATQPDCPVLVITAFASVDSAVEAMRRGAFHYLAKPFSVETLLAEAEKAFEHGRLLQERRRLRECLSAEQGLGRLLGRSPAMVKLREVIADVAKADTTVLVTGETGTGKELVANAIHYASPRAGGPLVKVNCAALSETLLESELFGHEKGAFTGADRSREGRFERADGGTLFLDEISEMGAHVQAKLLRVLQGEAFERVGGDQSLRPDARVISATNRDALKAVESGRLRQDLFYRLNVVHIQVPPLKERREDIPLLAEHFLATYATRTGKNVRAIAPEAQEALYAYNWPGNIRELENCIERAVVLTRCEAIGRKDLPPPICGLEAAEEEGPATNLNLEQMEQRAILRALAETDWNKSQASARLGIFPSSLYKKMKRFGIPLKP
jgi:two-component system, NtrC family, response regulator HydG